MSRQLPDVQASPPDVTVGLNRVGVTGVEKLVKIDRGGDDRPLVLMAEFDAYANLPGWRKGIDMSRNMEVVDEILEATVSETTNRVEDICGRAAERLLEKHDYTTRAEVRMEAEYVVREETPESGRPTQFTADILASATANGNGTHEEVGARVDGMTVCPCSQGMSESRARETLRDLGVEADVVDAFLDRVPQAGHSQRGHATLTVRDEGSPDVDLNEIIEVARDAMSARIYNYAKRPDEDHVTFESHSNARFVEDCVRAMADGVVERFPRLPDDAVVTMRQENDESIHQHDAQAERVSEFGQLKAEVNGGERRDRP